MNEAKQEPVAVNAAEIVLGVLYERKGFDDWWDAINVDLQQEILAEINAAYPATEAKQEPVAWMEMVVANLVREGVNKHKARELAQHFATHPAPVNTALLEALKKLYEGCTGFFDKSNEDMQKARAAIAQAEKEMK